MGGGCGIQLSCPNALPELQNNVLYAFLHKPSQVAEQMNAEGFADEDAAIAVQVRACVHRWGGGVGRWR